MADLKTGKILEWRTLSNILATFRLIPAPGERFPDYQPGQYIALRREDCRLTKRVAGDDGRPRFVTVTDDEGKEKRGPVTHSYSILSAPFETSQNGYLEFYVVLETDEEGQLGRLTESLFRGVDSDAQLTYVNRIVGDFTLPKRAAGFNNVCWVGTGTGLAPFMSMIRQLNQAASHGAPADNVQYTLVHTNRTFEELAYHDELLAIEAARRFDFAYVASVSRPTARDLADPCIGSGRANNLLRHMLGMPTREQQDLAEARAKGEDEGRLKAAVERATVPALAKRLSPTELQRRLEPGRTVILTCGNPSLMADVKYIAESNQIHFEKEDW
jgi:ferredoxin-NADP reductase